MTTMPASRSRVDVPAETGEVVLAIDGLNVDFAATGGSVPAVRGVGLTVRAGEMLAIVGESGSGKSVTARSIMRLLPATATVTGSMSFRGRDVFAMDDDELRRYRGGDVAMVFQDPQSSLNPVMTIGAQVAEAMTVHGVSKAQAVERAVEMLGVVGVPDPRRRVDEYPHQFSGGMRQRVGIAMALANNPAVLIADEPTTALDVTVQAQILDTFARLNRTLGTAVVIITHNVGVVARLCDRVAVMYGGRIAETGPVRQILTDPSHPYTAELLRAVPRLDAKSRRLHVIQGQPADPGRLPAGCPFQPRCRLAEDRCTEAPPLTPRGEGQEAACWVSQDRRLPSDLDDIQPGPERTPPRYDAEPALSVRGARKTFLPRAGWLRRRANAGIRALDGVDLELFPGETVGLVGESGCGKSTLARGALGLLSLDEADVRVDGADLIAARGADLRRLRRHVQIVFQDPYSSLNPRHTVGALIAEPLKIHRIVPVDQVGQRVRELLDMVGLPSNVANRLPREFSGGQKQRIAIARALATEPSVVVLDEPVSSLDVSLQAQVVNLLVDLQARLGVAYLFVAHDLALVRAMSDRIAVMYLGQVVEQGDADDVCADPLHPYTASLLSAVPDPDPTTERTRERIVLSGDVPSPAHPPAGCRFHTRCPVGPATRADREICATTPPPLMEVRPGRRVACHFAEETPTLLTIGARPLPSTNAEPA